jgi:hypothetical protein
MEFHRTYRIGGLILRVESERPLQPNTFQSKFQAFETASTRHWDVRIRHGFGIPEDFEQSADRLTHFRPPWAVFRTDAGWTYVGFGPRSSLADHWKVRRQIFVPGRNAATPEVAAFPRVQGDDDTYLVVLADPAHQNIRVFHRDDCSFRRGGCHSLSFMPTDQVLLARIMAGYGGCLLHAAGIQSSGRGCLFVGHSGCGKSSLVKLLRSETEILCDDRIIVRQNRKGFRIYGTWSHGEVPDVSPASAFLQSVFFPVKSGETSVQRLSVKQSMRCLLPCLIRPPMTARWMLAAMNLLEALARTVPCYRLLFNLSGDVNEPVRSLCFGVNGKGMPA